MGKDNSIFSKLKGWMGLGPKAVNLSPEAKRALNHVLNGIVLYYRDTDTHGLTERGLSTVGRIVETDRPLLATRLAGRCQQRVRFVIATALLNDEQPGVDGVADAAQLRAWDARVLRTGSLLKVMDVFRYHDTIQVTLLHIDHHHARLFAEGGELASVHTITQYSRHTAGYDLIEITRSGLRDKYDLGPRTKDNEDLWRKLTAPLFAPITEKDKKSADGR